MPDRAYDFRLIPIAVIDAPAFAMRETMNDRALEELAADIRDVGLRQPIGVRPTGERFRVSYGHRRRIACELAGETLIPCFVLADDDDDEERGKVTENWLREETNPAEEATYFEHQLTHRYQGDIERLCRALGVKESRVNARLDLLRGDAHVFAALKRKQIVLAVARELNRVRKTDWCRYYLSEAITHGATASVVQRWRMEFDRRESLAASEVAGDTAATPAASASPLSTVDTCPFCMLPGSALEMKYILAHADCLSVQLRAARAMQGGAS